MLNNTENLNPINESFGTVVGGMNGKTIEQFIKEGKEWAKAKYDEGWRYTVMGWLSPEEINEAGLIFDNNLEEVWDYEQKKKVAKSKGYCGIPTQEYYIEDSRLGPLGSKYIGASKKFLAWYSKRLRPEYTDENEKHIEQETKKWNKPIKNEWEVEDIVF